MRIRFPHVRHDNSRGTSVTCCVAGGRACFLAMLDLLLHHSFAWSFPPVYHLQIKFATLEKNELKPWLKKQWCLPPKANGEFVYHMEDVLAVYKRPYDPRRPQVCLDEASKQLLKDKRERLPMRPGDAEHYDSEYEREGVCNIFVASEPLAGQRYLQVREQRTKKDFAEFVRELIDVHYPQAEKIVLVMDNLNTHSPASFSEAFEPAEAWRLSQKLEIHYTPTHGSWLNM